MLCQDKKVTMTPRYFIKLAVLALVVSEVVAFDNLRRRPVDYEETERASLVDESEVELAMAPLRSFSDPQRIVAAVTGTIPASQSVLVSCEFENKWTPETHPTDYPTDAHWSPIILASHSNEYQMWSLGSIASRGVQEVAEVCTVKQVAQNDTYS